MSTSFINRMFFRMFTTADLRSFMVVESPRSMTVVTRRHKVDRRNRSEDFVVSVGGLNYRARQLVKRAKRDGRDFPLEHSRWFSNRKKK